LPQSTKILVKERSVFMQKTWKILDEEKGGAGDLMINHAFA
jgi:hypothetical protein